MNPSKDGYIHVNSEWALQADSLQVTLFHKRVAGPGAKNAGQLQYDPIGYYPNFSMALQAMVDRDIQPLNHIDYMVSRLEELKEWIADSLKNIDQAPQNPHSGEIIEN